MTNDGMTNDELSRRLTDADEVAFWADGAEELSALRETPPGEQREQRVYDLEERTARFGEAVIDFALTIAQGPVTNRLIGQLVGAATSVGANYCEADDAYSRNEFRKNIGICKKEARETKFQLRMVVRAVPTLKPQARVLWQEAKELHLIFAAILRRTPRQEARMTNDGMTKAKAGATRSDQVNLLRRQAELAELRTILEKMSDDPMAKPLLVSRARSLEAELAEMEKRV